MGLLYIAERGAGRVVRLRDANLDGEADGIEVVAKGINQPNSLALPRMGRFMSRKLRASGV